MWVTDDARGDVVLVVCNCCYTSHSSDVKVKDFILRYLRTSYIKEVSAAMGTLPPARINIGLDAPKWSKYLYDFLFYCTEFLNQTLASFAS